MNQPLPEWLWPLLFLVLTWVTLWVVIIYGLTRIGVGPRPQRPKRVLTPPPEYRYEEYRVIGPARQKPLPRHRGKAMFPPIAVRRAVKRGK